MLADKPQIVDRVLGAIANGLNEGDLVISVAAGVPLEAIEARLPDRARVIRSMPNTAAIALAGATAIAPGAHATSDDVDVAQALFDAVGRCVVLDCSRPASWFVRLGVSLYLRLVMPLAVRLRGGDAAAYRYLSAPAARFLTASDLSS